MDRNDGRRPFEVLQWVMTQKNASPRIGPAAVAYQLQIFLCGGCLGVAALSSELSMNNRPLQAFLASIVILNVAYTGFRAHRLTALATEQHRDGFFLFSDVMLSEMLSTLLYIIIATASQIFFAIRVIRILRAKTTKLVWLAVFVFLLAAGTVGWAGAIQAQTEAFLGRRADVHDQGYGFLELHGSSAHFVAAAANDILISVTLACRLHRDILGFNERTDSILRRLVRTTLATAALTSVTASMAAALAIMYEAKLFTNWSMEIPVYPLPSLYCLSVFWTLNLRSRLRREQRQGHVIEFSSAPASDWSQIFASSERRAPRISLPDEALEEPLFGFAFGPLSSSERQSAV